MSIHEDVIQSQINKLKANILFLIRCYCDKHIEDFKDCITTIYYGSEYDEKGLYKIKKIKNNKQTTVDTSFNNFVFDNRYLISLLAHNNDKYPIIVISTNNAIAIVEDTYLEQGRN